ncbi:MAG: CapA family protein [Ornithinimicrobium sp.]
MSQQTHRGTLVAGSLGLAIGLTMAGCGAEDPESSDGASSQTQEGQDSATTEETASESPADRTITIAASGDELPHAPVLESASANASGGGYDFGPMFAQIEPLVSSADLALCHMETPLSADNTNLTQPRVLSFASPHELADDLAAAGYDGCDFASNHTMDRGVSGLAETEDVLNDADLGYAGPSGYQDRAGEAYTYDVEGVTVAHLAYTYTLPNASEPTTDVPGDAPWLAESLWPVTGSEGIEGDAQRAREDGADVVVVSMHWGAEYNTEPTTDQTEIAQELLESSAVDLILGTHVHVPQPCAKINDRFVLYGLGNSLSNQSPEVDSRLRTETQEGMGAEVTLTVAGDGAVTSKLAVQPTRVNLNGHVVEPVGPQNYPESAQRTMDTLTSLGTCKPSTLTP